MSGTMTAWCSWCFQKTNHSVEERSYLSRTVYRCSGCSRRTLGCRWCKNMAKGVHDSDGADKSTWNDELCAEHDGTIASFDRLSLRLSDLEDYEQVFKREVKNLRASAKTAGGVVVGAALAVPAALLSAPAIASTLGAAGFLGAASTGTAISSLSGAALTSASLAALGGSVATGTAVVGAAGAALGAWQGGLTSNAYMGEVKDFKISKINEGSGPSIVFIDGFLTKDSDTISAWRKGARGQFSQNPWYHLQWESGALRELGALAGSAAGAEVRRRTVRAFARRASKAAPIPLAWLSHLAGVARNPWHKAFIRAAMTGAVLADMLARTENPDGFILVGHSLGARVAACTLQALGTRQEPPVVRQAVLLGGATSNGDAELWESAANAVSGQICNAYSSADDVLRFLYRGANAFLSCPIGLQPISYEDHRIRNIDVSAIVGGHMEYKPNLPAILERLMD